MRNKAQDQNHTTKPIPDEWNKAIKRYLLSKKKLHVLSYQDISKRLASYKINQSPQNLSAKFNKGRLSASLMSSSLMAMGEKVIDLQELKSILAKIHFERQEGK